MATWVEWIEPYGNTSYEVVCRVRVEHAIHAMMQKHDYLDWNQALADFCTIHWASIKEYNE